MPLLAKAVSIVENNVVLQSFRKYDIENNLDNEKYLQNQIKPACDGKLKSGRHSLVDK
jgi:hypothetical protein